MPRPSLPRSARRVPINARISPETAADIKDFVQRLSVNGQGEALDLLATEARRTPVLRSLIESIIARDNERRQPGWRPERSTADSIRLILGRLPTPTEMDAIDPAGGDEAADH